jgi:hypothetical protein
MIPPKQDIGYKNISYYFIPLAIQAISQSFTYPLVAIVATKGEGGPLNFAGLMQGINIMNIMGMLGSGLITTGMVFGKSKEGYEAFRKLAIILGVIVCFLQLLLIIPMISHFVLVSLLNLPPQIEKAAYQTILVSVPLQILFFIRNPYTVVLYNNKETVKASIPSFARIFLTVILSKLFVMIDLVGPSWAMVCIGIPVALETALYKYYATPFIKNLKSSTTDSVKKMDMFIFNIPLSISTVLVFFTTFLMAAYIARAPNSVQMLPVYYLALGLVSPMNFAASKIQPIVILFAEETKGRFILPKYALFAGIFLGAIPLLFLLPWLSNFYYVNVQNLNPADLPLIKETALLLFFVPIAVALRAYTEGLAAYQKKNTTYITGQAIYLSTAAVLGFFALNLGLPGNLIGCIGLIFANLASAATMRLSLFWDKQSKPGNPSGPGGPIEQI